MIEKHFELSSNLYLNSRNIPTFLNGKKEAARWELQKLVFVLKSDSSLLSRRTVGVAGIFLLLKNLFLLDQDVFGAISGLCHSALILAI